MSKNYYELTYIINPVLEEDEQKGIVTKFTEFINDNGGEIDEIDEWGIRKLAFEMDGKNSGYYVNLYFEAPGELIDKMERQMRLDDNVIRYLTLKYDAKMKRHRAQQVKGTVPDVFAHEHDDDDDDDDE